MHPSPSTFIGAESLWWRVTRASGDDVCAIGGGPWLLATRTALGLAPLATWDVNFASALLNAATVLEWPEMADTLRSDLAARRPSRAATAFATWFAFYRPNRIDFTRVSIPADIVLPAWGAVLPAAPERLVCFRPGAEPAPWSLSSADRIAAEDASALGVRVRAGEPVEQGPEEPGPSTSGVGLALGALLLLIAGAVFLKTTQLTNEPKPARRPARARLARANPSDWLGEAFS